MKELGRVRRMFYRDGLSLSEISRKTGFCRNTIKRRYACYATSASAMGVPAGPTHRSRLLCRCSRCPRATPALTFWPCCSPSNLAMGCRWRVSNTYFIGTAYWLRQTLARWVIGAGRLLQPLHNLMRDTLTDGPFLHVDETVVQVLKEDGKPPTCTSYMWVQTGGPPGKPVVLYDYDPSRSGSLSGLDAWRQDGLQAPPVRQPDAGLGEASRLQLYADGTESGLFVGHRDRCADHGLVPKAPGSGLLQ